VARDLRDDVGGRAEAVQPESLRLPRKPQRPVPDQPRAQQRRSLQVLEAVGNRKTEPLIRDRPLGVPAIDVVSGEARKVAKVLAAGRAVPALATRPAQPRNAQPAPVIGLADDLVAGDQRHLRAVELPVDDVQIGPANAAGEHAKQHLTVFRLRGRHLLR
jgi:hypothetical protein